MRSIRGVDDDLAAHAGRAVNISLTIRNWLIGCYIAEYEQCGADRARYGERLLAKLSDRLGAHAVSRAEERKLRRYRRFYQTYPQIREALTPELSKHLAAPAKSPSAPIREALTPETGLGGRELIARLSFSHETIGQLNTYVSWYAKNMMEAGDNPPVGILLCTRKDRALVEYALAGMDNRLFVSKYQSFCIARLGSSP